MRMDTKELYREVLNEHNINPSHKKEIGGAVLSLKGVNPSCGDAIELNLVVQDNVIVDGAFTGNGCAVSQASCDMMLDLVIGKTREEAMRLSDIFMRMIKNRETVTDEEMAELDEAASLEDIARMPSRTKCAVLGWRTMNEMMDKNKKEGQATNCHCGEE